MNISYSSLNEITRDDLSKMMMDSQTQRTIIEVVNQNLSDREIAPIVEKTLSAINVKTLTAAEIKPMIIFFNKHYTGTLFSLFFLGTPAKLMIQAAQAGNGELVRLLIENGTNVNQAIYGGFNILNTWISNLQNSNNAITPIWNNEITRIFIENGFKMHLKDSSGDTILHYVSLCEYADLTLLCLEKGASVNKQDNYGYTPLHYACLKGNVDIARHLINKGANLELKENGEMTPLLLACRKGHFGVAKLLLENKASIDAKAFTEACSNWNPEFVRLLIENGANVHSTNSNGSTSLHVACLNKHAELAQLCLDKGADINAQNKFGYTPLHVACIQGDLVTARLLLEKGADINIKDENGNTPLHLACKQGSLEVVTTLIDHGANVIERNHNGESPLHFACEMGKAEIAARLLLKNGAKVNEKNRHDVLVHFEKFIKRMYDRLVGNNQENPQTPLQLACKSKNRETVTVLLENQADINQADLEGTTPLHIACQERCEGIALELIEKGANPRLPNKNGKTPLDIAKENKLLEVAPPETDTEIEAFLSLKELDDFEKAEQENAFSFLSRINLHIKNVERVSKRSGSSKIKEWIDRTKPRMEAMRNQFREILKNNPFSSSELPDEFKCPIGLNLINDGVYLLNLDGSLFPHAFDRKNIEKWHDTQKSQNKPLTIPLANVPTFDTYINADDIYRERAAEIEKKLNIIEVEC